MSSTKKNKLLKTLLTANITGCGCGKLKPSDVYEPTPKPKSPIPQRHSSSSSCDKNDMSFTVDDDDEDRCSSSTTISHHPSHHRDSYYSFSAETTTTNPKNTSMVSSSSKPATWTDSINDSIAVVKESDDPYLDFRQSMLQMIVEKQIYSKEGLQELLSCFLELNSQSHHQVIIQAFKQIWNDLIINTDQSEKPHRPCDSQL